MPGDSGATAVNTRVHVFTTTSHARLPAHWAPGVPPRPPGREVLATARAHCAARPRTHVWTTTSEIDGPRIINLYRVGRWRVTPIGPRLARTRWASTRPTERARCQPLDASWSSRIRPSCRRDPGI